MGKSKTVVSQLLPKSSIESQESDTNIDPSTLDIEFDINESLNGQILQEEPEKDSGSQLDFLEEEEEWNKYRIVSEDNGLAQGVTYEELSNVEMMLQQDILESSQKETAIATVQKIYGTELHTLLENSIENASQKIAELLDNSIYTKKTGSSILQNNHSNPFNIDGYIT
ncbi:conjugal transfer protein TraD [Chryseobacterium turcicum]|uniref:Conjugal transfer protein TraD n=1 Tax=Chryseobacterium turcicum TaxID=2898076 RepID=A0A9Q3V4C5_9FLAO|nr:conjugal transfer protein TraD [Chryseobacterium turcicum]MCD1117473.1 conjugal transfer protein TraD [Chryseobacterium turcicum]